MHWRVTGGSSTERDTLNLLWRTQAGTSANTRARGEKTKREIGREMLSIPVVFQKQLRKTEGFFRKSLQKNKTIYIKRKKDAAFIILLK